MNDYPLSERLLDLKGSRSATFALVHKVRSMRGEGFDPGPVVDSQWSVGYRCGPICPYYSAEDLANYERELADLDRQIADLELQMKESES